MDSIADNTSYLELVKKAQLGCQESMAILARRVERRVFAYIFRLTLDYNAAQDLRQETLLEMVNSLKRLKFEHANQFWSWLYRTALGKVQHHFRNLQLKRIVHKMSALDKEHLSQRVSESYGNGLKNMINKELSQAIVDAMAKLKLRHRNILVLRCCEQLPYPEIAEVMDCSELAAQVLFFRAKHSLKRQLSKHGFGKGLLLPALGLFGKMTTPADAAPISVSATSTEVGVAATVIGAAGTKLGLTIATLATAIALTVGSFTLNNTYNTAGFGGSKLPKRSEVKSFHYVEQAWDSTGPLNTNLARGRSLNKGAYEQWYYFPEGIDGPMFTMMQRWDPQQKDKLCGWLENSQAIYKYNSGSKTVYIGNYRLWNDDMRTRRLPSDTPEFTEFLNKTEGKFADVTYTRDPKTGLLVGALDNAFYNARNYLSSIKYNTLDETSFGSFRYSWPKDALVVDERDEMHKRGWTYFRITGEINNEQVYGTGQIPFVYNAIAEHPPWLKLHVGNRLVVTDSPSGTYVAVPDGRVVATYPTGSFFKGLARPWMGMHTIDIIRRDAAEKRVEFSTRNLGSDGEHYGKAQVTLIGQAIHGQIQIAYTIYIDKDIIETIEFSTSDHTKDKGQGILRFSHLEEVEQLTYEFTEPAKMKVRKAKRQDSMGMLWLIELAQGTLGRAE